MIGLDFIHVAYQFINTKSS